MFSRVVSVRTRFSVRYKDRWWPLEWTPHHSAGGMVPSRDHNVTVPGADLHVEELPDSDHVLVVYLSPECDPPHPLEDTTGLGYIWDMQSPQPGIGVRHAKRKKWSVLFRSGNNASCDGCKPSVEGGPESMDWPTGEPLKYCSIWHPDTMAKDTIMARAILSFLPSCWEITPNDRANHNAGYVLRLADPTEDFQFAGWFPTQTKAARYAAQHYKKRPCGKELFEKCFEETYRIAIQAMQLHAAFVAKDCWRVCVELFRPNGARSDCSSVGTFYGLDAAKDALRMELTSTLRLLENLPIESAESPATDEHGRLLRPLHLEDADG